MASGMQEKEETPCGREDSTGCHNRAQGFTKHYTLLQGGIANNRARDASNAVTMDSSETELLNARQRI